MRQGDEHVDDEVLLLGLHAHQADAAAALLLVRVQRNALDVTVLGDGDHHVLVGDEVLVLQVPGVHDDVGVTLVAVLLLQLEDLGLDDGHDAPFVGQDVLQVRDLDLELGELGAERLDLQPGKLLQPHVQDGLGLLLVDLQSDHQALARLLRALGLTYDAYGVVQGVQRLDQADEDVLPLPGLGQVVLGAAGHDLLAIGEIVPEQLLQREHLGLVVDQGDVDDPEGHLHLGLLEQVVEDDLWRDVAAKFDDDAHAVAVRFVAQVGDAFDALVLDQLGDGLDEVGLVDLVGDLVDDDALPPLPLLHAGLGPHLDLAAPGAVGLDDAPDAVDSASGREIRRLDELHQVPDLGLRVLDDVDDGVHHLGKVVGRHVGGHPHGDAGGPVDQKVGQLARQGGWFLEAAIEVVDEVDGVLVDVAQHLHGDAAQTTFGVTHGRGLVPVDGAEVALAIDQWIAQ